MAKKTIEIDPAVVQKKAAMDNLVQEIKEIDYSIEELTQIYAAQQEALKDNYESKRLPLTDKRSFLLGQLVALFSEVPATSDTKTQKKVSLLNGDVVIKKASSKLDYDKAKLLEWAKANGMNELISTKEVEDFKWSEYKARLVVTECGIVDTETGELVEVEGLTVQEVPEEVQVKY